MEMTRRWLSLILVAAMLLSAGPRGRAAAVTEPLTTGPEERMEETTAPEETVPETSAAETTPETTTEETVPETTMEETIPETTAVETVPETTRETLPEELPAVSEPAAMELIRRGSQEKPMTPTAQNTVATLGNGSGIRFRIFNYTNGRDASGNYITAGGINDNGLDGWFNFRGSSYENTAADGSRVGNTTNSVTDIDGYTANHATVLPNLGSDGYPVFDGSRGGGPQKSLGYLFGAGGKGVTGYASSNTLLRMNEKGQYYYDSAANAVDFDVESNRFLVRNYRERGMTTAGQGAGNYYDFFPFTYWNGTFTAQNETGGWYNYDNSSEVDYWFGLTMEASFSMPAGGLVQGEEMVFSFSGDDDVWVFLDGVLVLDLGGTHGVVSGSVNFATGEVKQYLDWNGAGEGSEGTSYPTTLKARFAAAGKEPKGGWNGDVFANYTEHTIKFYYLERATSCANCRILFNMPILPTGTLTVEKEVEGTLTELTEDTDYGFVLLGQDTAGVPFDRIGPDGVVVETAVTDGEGGFSLKAGQKARFDLTAGRTFRVREEDPGQYARAVRCTVNGTVQELPGETGEITMDPDRPQTAAFVNALNTTSLTVRKEVGGNMGDRDRAFGFRVRLYDAGPGDGGGFLAFPTGAGYALEEGEARFTLKHGQEVTLTGIPAGAWAVVTEELAEGYETRYVAGDAGGTGRTATLPRITEPVRVDYTNSREVLIDTGVKVEWGPYIWMTVLGALLPGRKRKRYE